SVAGKIRMERKSDESALQPVVDRKRKGGGDVRVHGRLVAAVEQVQESARVVDRKSTRLNSSHSQISYAVFCLKKKCCWRRFASHPGKVHSQAEPADKHDHAHPSDDGAPPWTCLIAVAMAARLQPSPCAPVVQV